MLSNRSSALVVRGGLRLAMTTAWWSECGTPTQPRRRLFRRRPRPIRAEAPLRVAVHRSFARRVGRLEVAPSAPEAVAWLLRATGLTAERTASVNVEERPERVAAAAALQTSPPSQTRPVHLPDRDSTPKEPGKSSLADRLRLLLAVPLESLLPGPDTVLIGPASSCHSSSTVSRLVQRDGLSRATGSARQCRLQAIRILCVRRNSIGPGSSPPVFASSGGEHAPGRRLRMMIHGLNSARAMRRCSCPSYMRCCDPTSPVTCSPLLAAMCLGSAVLDEAEDQEPRRRGRPGVLRRLVSLVGYDGHRFENCPEDLASIRSSSTTQVPNAPTCTERNARATPP